MNNSPFVVLKNMGCSSIVDPEWLEETIRRINRCGLTDSLVCPYKASEIRRQMCSYSYLHSPQQNIFGMTGLSIECCKQRTSLEKFLITFSFITVAIIIALVVLFLLFRFDLVTKKRENYENRICSTKGCVQAANNLITAMNQSANPCENFFEYACGQWNRDHPIPDDNSEYGIAAIVGEKVQQQMRMLLESDTPIKSKSIEMSRIAYRTCMDTRKLEIIKSLPLLSAFGQLGKWPLLDGSVGWDESLFNLTHILAAARRSLGVEIFYQIDVYADAKNTTRNSLYINQAELGLGSRDYYLNSSLFSNYLDAYRKYQLEVVKLLMEDAGVTYNLSELVRNLNDTIVFETEFAKIIVPDDQRRNSTKQYNKKVISDLYTLFPKVDWVSFFFQITPASVHDIINNNTQIIVSEVDFLYDAAALINRTSNRLLANFIFWGIARSWVDALDSRYEIIMQDFVFAMTGQQKKPARWKGCVERTTRLLPQAAGALYVREHFDSTDKKEALKMVINLQAAFKDLVVENEWMAEQTKKLAQEKVSAMVKNIGYPDFISNDTALDDYYKKLNLTAQDLLFDLLRKVLAWSQERGFLRLKKPVDRHEFVISPAVVNALYSPSRNSITFPAGILTPPFFSSSYPKLVNYGGMGAVIGHEITHGFDDQGSQYDRDGNLQDWWDDDSNDKFVNRTQCIIDQYSSYKLPNTDFRINGELTLGENIADNGGLKAAYRAYRKLLQQLGHEEPHLPGFQDFSSDQVFFLSYAQSWCGHKKEAAALQQVLTDEHSPAMFRVVGVLSNLDEFSKAYNCPKGSRMNPPKRCAVW